jgi:hypothetical protein
MNSYQKWLRGSSKNNPDLEVMQKKHPAMGVFLYIIPALSNISAITSSASSFW